jgi:hypothetical protein
MKQNALQLDVAMKKRAARFLFNESQIRAHILGVLKLVTAFCPAAAHIFHDDCDLRHKGHRQTIVCEGMQL